MAEYNEKGEEIPDKKPVAMPIGYERPEPLEVMVARMVRVASNHSAALGNETLEEANDFGEDEEDDLEGSPYQFKTMEEEYLDEKPRTNPKGRTAGNAVDREETQQNSREVPGTTETGNETQRVNRRVGGESDSIGNKNRRSTDKARTNERRERRQADGNQTGKR